MNLSISIFPDNFPTNEEMIDAVKVISKYSWKNELSSNDIDYWLNNFNGKVFDPEIEKKLALWMLYNFIYYSQNEISYLCNILCDNLIHKLLIEGGIKNPNKKEIENILSSTFFTPLGNASESGGLILYHFRQSAELNIQKFIYYNKIVEKMNTSDSYNIICMDDCIMSGSSALTFYKKLCNDVDMEKTKCKVYFISLFATKDSLALLREKNINLVYSILLDSKNQYFSEDSICYSMFNDLLKPSKELASKYGENLFNPSEEGMESLGYKNGQYNIGMYYNTPNNSLPIFWSSRNNWHPIFPRKEKIYDKHYDRKTNFFY